MSTKTKNVWRLGTLPTPQELALLVTEGILTKEEAREILISQEKEEDRDKKSLQSEIKFLRELVDKLANNRRSEIVKTIEIVQTPYRQYGWFGPYATYVSTGVGSSSSTATISSGSATTLNAGYSSASGTNSVIQLSAVPTAFTAIKTF